jgi:hypothetical protein
MTASRCFTTEPEVWDRKFGMRSRYGLTVQNAATECTITDAARQCEIAWRTGSKC